jgi:hypothetical protein
VALGPVLPDDTLALPVISDDNFSDTRTNQVLLFEIRLAAVQVGTRAAS